MRSGVRRARARAETDQQAEARQNTWVRQQDTEWEDTVCYCHLDLWRRWRKKCRTE